MNAITTINEVMSLLPPSALGYEEWLQVGMALHAEGGSCADWETWSRNDTRFVSGECERKWSGFGRHGQSEIKCGSIVEMARRHGIDVSPKHVDDSEPDKPLDWDDSIEDIKAQRVIRSEYVVPAIIPDKKDWDPIDDLVHYIRAVFQSGEKFSVCMSAAKKEQADGSIRFHPSSSGNVLDVDKTLESLDKQATLKDEGDITNVLGPYNKEAGAWIRINPVSGDGGDDRSVSAWRHALVECDRKTPEEQLAIIREMNLPCAAIIHSGGHSVHAIVKIEAETKGEYQRRVDFLFDMCEKNGLPLDKQNRNPSRYSRLPGIVRGENRQFLIDTNCGAKSWQEWKDCVEEQNEDINIPETMGEMLQRMEETDNDDSELIKTGYLRSGGAMLFAAQTGIGKSTLIVQMCYHWAIGKTVFGFTPAHALKILYIQNENDERDIKGDYDNGLQPGLKSDNWTAEEIEKAKANIWIKREIAHVGNNFTKWLDRLLQKMQERIGKIDLVVIDPLLSYCGCDLSKQADTSDFLRAHLNRVLQERHVGCILVHHENKPKEENCGSNATYRYTGSADLANWARAIVSLQKSGESDSFQLSSPKRGKKLGWAFDTKLLKYDEKGLVYWRELNDFDRPMEPTAKDKKEAKKLEDIKTKGKQILDLIQPHESLTQKQMFDLMAKNGIEKNQTKKSKILKYLEGNNNDGPLRRDIDPSTHLIHYSRRDDSALPKEI
jgi:RecA-family ATPase